MRKPALFLRKRRDATTTGPRVAVVVIASK